MPFSSGSDQDKYAKLTMWEQLDRGIQYSPTKKLLTAVPIILYHHHHHTIVSFGADKLTLLSVIVLSCLGWLSQFSDYNALYIL